MIIFHSTPDSNPSVIIPNVKYLEKLPLLIIALDEFNNKFYNVEIICDNTKKTNIIHTKTNMINYKTLAKNIESNIYFVFFNELFLSIDFFLVLCFFSFWIKKII